MVRVRFAPSPTGNLHIGGARTALFNWLYARSQGGKFILRIEDTDTVRSKKEYLEEILFSLKWLGLEWDELYHQSERFAIYNEYARKLLNEGKAYEAEKIAVESETDPAQPVAAGKAIILKVLPRKVKIEDMIRGTIEFDTSVIKDQVLIKSDGSPTYNFACVIDDSLMNLTHIIRGDDHISNTPKQILLYEALGFDVPKFAHLPLILAKEGGRLSKRKGATAISEYRDMGYLAKSLVNFLMMLGWNPGDNREVIDVSEAIKLFDIRHINKTAAVLDMDKLDWFNNQYLKSEDPEKLAEALIPGLIEKGWITKDNFDRNYLLSLVKLLQARLTVLADFFERADFFFLEDYPVDAKAQEKFLNRDFSKEFSLFIDRLDKLDKFEAAEIEETFRQMVVDLGIEAKVLIHPIRVALTGRTVGPGLFELISCLGKERTKRRLAKWVKKET